MAQHDYDIENSSFPAFRTNLNGVLSAINSTNSGSSRPSSAVAGTIWLDTSGAATAQLLKLYDGADDILLGTINFTANTIDWSDSAVDGVTFKEGGTSFTDSLLIGHTTTGTLNNADRNIGIGRYTLQTVTSGDDNVAIGWKSGRQITYGQGNTFLGKESGEAVTGQTGNTGVGFQAGKASYGNYNTFLGYEAGENISGGSGNVIIGRVNADSASGARQLKIAGNDGSTTTTWISGDSNGQVKLISGYVLEVALTDAATITWNAATQPVAKVTLGASRTMGLPSNPVSGQFISLLIIQDGTGSRTITWNAAYEFAADTAPTLTATANLGDLFTFRYNGAKWLEVGRNLALTLS